MKASITALAAAFLFVFAAIASAQTEPIRSPASERTTQMVELRSLAHTIGDILGRQRGTAKTSSGTRARGPQRRSGRCRASSPTGAGSRRSGAQRPPPALVRWSSATSG